MGDWISVDDALPETWDSVLCWYEFLFNGEKHLTYWIGWYHYKSNKWYGDETGSCGKVLFWQPLPEPPEGGAK